MPQRASSISIDLKFKTGGLLDVDEFSAWAGQSRGTTYNEIRAGRLRLTKIGRAAKIAADDAVAWRDALRTAAA